VSQPTNPLVASPQDDTTAITGIGIAESAADAYNGIADQSWIEAGLGVAGTGLEVLGMVMDPVGSVFAAGVGWLIEHVGPLQEVLDDLAGDPPTIRSYGETWNNVAAELTAIQDDLADAVNSELSGWTGDAADAYREASAGRTEALNGAATVCSGVGLVVTLVGELVAAVREFLRDLIADAVGRLIAWALQVAATLGVGITWVAPQAAAFCAKVAANIADIVRKLLKTLRNVSRRIADLMKSFDDIRGVLQRLARRDGRSPDAADNAPASTSPTASPTTSDSSTSPLTTTSPSSTPTAPVSDIDSRAGNSDGPSRGSDETTPPDELSQSPSETVSDRTGTSIETSDDAQHAARETVIRNDGQPIGVEDGPGVRIVSEDELQWVRDDLHTTLGAPAHKLTPKGTIEVWTLSRDPHVTVTYRPFSKSGGPTIDFNGVEGLDVKRLHIPYEGGEK
jgi:hypothetical protein